MKFHDIPSEKPENTNIDAEKSKQNLEFYNLEFKPSSNLVILWVDWDNLAFFSFLCGIGLACLPEV